MKSKILGLLAVGLLAGPMAGTAHATMYTVGYNGDRLDLTGYIDVNSVGTYNPTAFNALAVDYLINVLIDNTWSFAFSTNDSTWGDNAFGSWGDAITIQVSATEIHISSSLTDDFNPQTLFLMTDAVHNGALENLRISGNRLGMRPPIPGPGDSVAFDSGRPIPFATAVAVPEPGSVALLGLGLLGLGLSRRKKAA